jgi:tetratricopeptide (TPR) repeat protein
LRIAASFADSDISVVEKPFMEARYERAISEANRLIDERARQRDEIYYMKGTSELKLGKFNDARQSFDAIIKKYPRSNRVFDAYLGIGDSYFLDGNMEAAAKRYNEIKENFPSDKNIALVDSRLADCRKKSGDESLRQAPPQMPQEASAPAVQNAKGSISVQVGCFKSGRNAEALAAKLSSRGYQSYVEAPVGSGDRLYHVKVGRIKFKSEAELLAARLNRDGYNTKICDETDSQ